MVAESDVVILAVKPQQMERVMAGLRGLLAGRHLVISIAAGIRLAALAEGLGGEVRLIRVMPNTPCLVGRGASAYSLGPRATAADGRVAEELLRAVGIALPVEEKLLDAVTGLSGCGPAFVYVVIEALADGGVKGVCPAKWPPRWPPRPCWAPAKWSSPAASTPACSRTAWPVPAAPPSPACKRSRRAACGPR